MVKIKDKRTKRFWVETGEGFKPENLTLTGAKLVSNEYGAFFIEVPANSVSFDMRYFPTDEGSDDNYLIYYKGPYKSRNESGDDWTRLGDEGESFEFSTNCYWAFWIIDSTD